MTPRETSVLKTESAHERNRTQERLWRRYRVEEMNLSEKWDNNI